MSASERGPESVIVPCNRVDCSEHGADLGDAERVVRCKKHPDVMQWVCRRGRLTLQFTPTYASRPNLVEIWFNIFTRDVVKNGVWKSRRELVDQIMF
jgi:hypothetical protein